VRGTATRLLSDNLVPIVGVALPLGLMALFFIAGRATEALTDPPGYDALLAVNHDERRTDQPWHIELQDGRLVIRTDARTNRAARRAVTPELHLLDHATLRTSRIAIDLASLVDGVVRDPDLDALNRRHLLAGPESPDGYRLERRRRAPTGGLVGDLLGFGRNRSRYVLRSDARTIAIRSTEPLFQAHLVAWIAE
jgi:hypothetical protein